VRDRRGPTPERLVVVDPCVLFLLFIVHRFGHQRAGSVLPAREQDRVGKPRHGKDLPARQIPALNQNRRCGPEEFRKNVESLESLSGRTCYPIWCARTAVPRIAALLMLRSTISTVSAPATAYFVAQSANPTQSLYTLRGRRYRLLTQHSLVGDPLRSYPDRSFAGWNAPALAGAFGNPG